MFKFRTYTTFDTHLLEIHIVSSYKNRFQIVSLNFFMHLLSNSDLEIKETQFL